MKYLIIPDIHHHWKRAETIISYEGADHIVLLGDYFDDFNDTTEMVEATANWLASSVIQPNRTHLFGNHEIPYAFNKIGICSGFTDKKYNTIKKHCNWNNTWKYLKWYYIINNTWLLTHAGLSSYHLPHNIDNYTSNDNSLLYNIDQYLSKEAISATTMLKSRQYHWFITAGASRGGYGSRGGITWLDYNKEFMPIDDINQIIGHTPISPEFQHTRLFPSNKSHNYNLDSYEKVACYAIINNNNAIELKYYCDI